MTPAPQTAVQQAPEPEVLLEIKSMFPFDFFPDRVKLTNSSLVVIKAFFIGSQTTTFMLDDIMNIEISTSLFTSTISIIRKGTPLPPVKVRNMANADAEKLKNMVQGLMVLKTEHVNLEQANSQQVIKKADTIGKVTA